jgi:serine/threonine protein kinase
MEPSQSFLQLHAQGLFYRDISFGNVFFDPDNGEILICDNDNVGIDGQSPSGVLGTPRFMAPEIVRGEASPSIQTDLFSLSVLLFYLLMVHHPFEGKREAEIHCFDLPAMTRLYGTQPVFIFDPQDESNRPVPGIQENAILYWQLYPQFLRNLFSDAFTEGIRDPKHGRVRESEWRAVLARLRDAIFYCKHCGAENFFDEDLAITPRPCWSCKQPLRIPLALDLGGQVVMLNHDTRLFPHHLDPDALYDFRVPLAEVAQHPQDTSLWGLKNLSSATWRLTTLNGTVKDVPPGRSTALAPGARLNFGKVEGEIKTAGQTLSVFRIP